MPKNQLISQLEAILFFKSEPVTASELHKLLGIPKPEVEEALAQLGQSLEGRGITLVTNGEEYSLGTSPQHSALIEQVQKEEFTRDLGRAGLETLAIVLYRGPVTRREIDVIRGVNSSFILRSLLVRGLVERVDGSKGFSYKPTLKLLEHLGVRRIDQLPDYEESLKAVKTFLENQPKEDE